MPTTIDARVVPISDLVIAANVRTDTQVDKPFVSNVKQYGILVPITVALNDAGGYDVIDGQRRTLAARDAGLTEVPVIVAHPQTTNDRERIIEQLVVNDHRAALTDAEHTAAWKQLSLFGVSADQISRKVNAPKKRVESALAVAGSAAAATAIATHQLTIDQALVITTFDGNDDAIARLDQVAAEKPEQLEHEAARIRQEQKVEALRQTLLAELAELGIPVLEESPSYDDKTWQSITSIYTNRAEYERLSIDQALAEAADDVAASIYWGWDGQEQVWSARYFLRNWVGHGWEGSSSSAAKPDLTDAEKEERRVSRETTKAWKPATAVRLAWIRDLLQRRSVPRDAEAFAARYFAATVGNSTPYGHSRTTLDLLGIGSDQVGYAGEELPDGTRRTETVRPTDRLLLEATPLRHQHVLLAIALAGTEAQSDFDKTGWKEDGTAGYLTQLSAWGYTLSEVEERIVTDAQTAAAAAADTLAYAAGVADEDEL